MKNENFKKVDDTFKAQLSTKISEKLFADLIARTKSATSEESGTFKVIVSTADQDRQGESVNQAGWDLTFFKTNPVVLWAHDYSSLPIGMCTSIEVRDGKLVAEGKFAPEDANPFAQQVRRLYELGMVCATSVGFIPKEFDNEKAGVISKSELLEFSFVPVPANPFALRLDQMKTLKIDVVGLKTKGIEIVAKEDVPPVEPPQPQPQPQPQPEPAPEVKGEVSAELNLIEMREEKWEKYCEICEAMDAFCTVYFDERTPVEDFGKLLGETISILQQIVSDGGVDDDEKRMAGGMIVKLLAGRKSISETLKKNAEILKVAADNVIKNVAFGSLALSTGGKNDNKENVVVPKVGNSEALKELNSFVEARELLRGIDIAVEKVLAKFNNVARKRQ